MTEVPGEDNEVPEQIVVRSRKSRIELQQLEHDTMWKDVLATYEGRYVVWLVLEQCGIYQPSFTADAATTAWKEGKRAIGLTILGDLFRIDPNMYALMQQEATKRSREKGEQRDE